MKKASVAWVFAIVLLLCFSAPGQTFNTLADFGGSNGLEPYGRLTRDSAGSIYGTTVAGGAPNNSGVLWKITGTTETVLHIFTGPPVCNPTCTQPDGAYPYGGAIIDKNGNLYGTTMNGGIGSNGGTVWRVSSSSGAETILYTFASASRGYAPNSGLIVDKGGNLYGTTTAGGAYGYGVIYKVNPKTGKETVLYSFNPAQSSEPEYANLLMDKVGNLYGVTPSGGAYGNGVVFEFSAARVFTVLYNFQGGTNDGCYPYGTLVPDSSGNLYGTTYSCGLYGGGMGTVFKLNIKTGKEKILYNFAGGTEDGATVFSGVIRDKAGDLYGVTRIGGTYSYGVMFKLSQAGVETILHSFNESSDGGNPEINPLLMDSVGNLYGACRWGGTYSGGTVYELTP